MNSPLPLYTLSILAVSVLAYTLPELGSVLVFDRAAILNGEVWRILSGHTVHFSPRHLTYDLLAFGLIGGVIEHKHLPNCSVLYLVMAIGIGVSLLVLKPGMHYYGGLSGLACGAAVYLALTGLRDNIRLRLLNAFVLILVVSKIAFELLKGQTILHDSQQPLYVPMPISHLVGVLAAMSVFFFSPSGRISPVRRQPSPDFSPGGRGHQT